MAQYLALTYTADVDWFDPEHAAELTEPERRYQRRRLDTWLRASRST